MSGFTGKRTEFTERVELHVFYVPDDQFDRRLNKVSAEAVDTFISAGFIRVDSDVSLSDLRSDLGTFLGLDRIADRYVFLKCVGRSLALVKFRQEKELTVKSFTPPFAPFPELYLLPFGENDRDLCSSSLTPDTLISNTNHHSHDLPRPTCAPGKIKEPIKFPSINKGPQQSVLMQDAEDESDEDTGSSDTPHLTYGLQDQMESLHKQSEIDTAAKKKHCFKKNNRNCGATELFEDSRGLARNFSSSLTLKSSEERTDDMVLMSRPTSPLPAERSSPLSVYSLELYTQETTTKNKLIEEIKLFKEQRKELERSRQELLKKGRELLALNRHRRNQARDQWKRQYFNTKKATILLEDTLKSVRLDLHTFYCKMLQQLQARDGAKGQTQGKKQSSTKLKNDLIIQIMTESSEIDNLRKNVDDVKMKLATESKLRKQAATELRALRAELMQKRAQL
ncbi:spermatogenesis-associated protein 1 isoform X1 [Puntigrus tetrazona]|uniref:spermatogenesis-associated protein 1 isoform X1 n=1 Tax=Puntigrus tetrazona TaxID=1606681 RepID=UPI001C8AA3FC|nr:spermatogenesis-associated protein 1 isoform X1 [Puntigrus tetrazona]